MAQPKKINEPFFVFILHNTPQRFNLEAQFFTNSLYGFHYNFALSLQMIIKSSSSLRFIYVYRYTYTKEIVIISTITPIIFRKY